MLAYDPAEIGFSRDKMSLPASTLFIALMLATASARPAYRDLIPNANQGLRCDRIGHYDCLIGNKTVNAFGQDFAKFGYVWSKEFCERDSDGDKVSNGAELGDPCCEWTPDNGARLRVIDISQPGDKYSVPALMQHNSCVGKSPPERLLQETPSMKVMSSPGPGSACFPGNARVELRSGKMVQMRDLQVGDEVAVGKGKFSKVFMFTHKMRWWKNSYVTLKTESGAMVSATEDHFIYVNGRLMPVGRVGVGQFLELENGTSSRVVKVSREFADGLYNPQTLHGDIVADGIRTSTYTKALPSRIAHAVLSPLRTIYTMAGMYSRFFEN